MSLFKTKKIKSTYHDCTCDTCKKRNVSEDLYLAITLESSKKEVQVNIWDKRGEETENCFLYLNKKSVLELSENLKLMAKDMIDETE